MNKKNQLKKVIKVIICVGILLVIIKQQNDIMLLSKQLNENKGYNSEMFDSEYKLFYGEWEIVEFMGRSKYCPGESQHKIIGHHIYYDAKNIKIDGELRIENPRYMCAIIPCKYGYRYTNVKPADMESTELVWGDEEDYFIRVQVENIMAVNGKFIEFGDGFYIVDEDTLIVDTYDGWYRMERISYLEGYPDIM